MELKYYFDPWINSQNSIYSEGMIHESTMIHVCMGHLEVGFEMMRGIVNENGISKSTFRKFDSVFSGHFHVKSDDGHIYYLGEIHMNFTGVIVMTKKDFIYLTQKQEN